MRRRDKPGGKERQKQFEAKRLQDECERQQRLQQETWGMLRRERKVERLAVHDKEAEERRIELDFDKILGPEAMERNYVCSAGSQGLRMLALNTLTIFQCSVAIDVR